MSSGVTVSKDGVVTGNTYDKYGSSNPLVRRMMTGFERTLDELFAAAETLGRLTALPGKRLAILTNGGGIGVLAVDRLADFGGELAGISAETMTKLDAALPPIWSRADPVDIAGDADDARYAVALEQLLEDKENDAVLVMNVPTALASASEPGP